MADAPDTYERWLSERAAQLNRLVYRIAAFLGLVVELIIISLSGQDDSKLTAMVIVAGGTLGFAALSSFRPDVSTRRWVLANLMAYGYCGFSVLSLPDLLSSEWGLGLSLTFALDLLLIMLGGVALSWQLCLITATMGSYVLGAQHAEALDLASFVHWIVVLMALLFTAVSVDNQRRAEWQLLASQTEERVAPPAAPSAIQRLLHGNAQPWELMESDVRIIDRIGSGRYADVYMGRHQGKEVAVKILFQSTLSGATLTFEKTLLHDIGVLCAISHKNVIQLIGAVVDIPRVILVSSFSKRGSMRELIEAGEGVVDWPLRSNMALDAALGMRCLHSNGIVHGDLKSSNLLLSTTYTVGVSDALLAGWIRSAQPNVASPGISHREGAAPQLTQYPMWSAPEVLRGEPRTQASDVYSFGICLWELMAWELPFRGSHPANVQLMVGMELVTPETAPVPPAAPTGVAMAPGVASDSSGSLSSDSPKTTTMRTAVPPRADANSPPQGGWRALAARADARAEAPKAYKELFRRCWSPPDQRPSFSEVVGTLQAIDQVGLRYAKFASTQHSVAGISESARARTMPTGLSNGGIGTPLSAISASGAMSPEERPTRGGLFRRRGRAVAPLFRRGSRSSRSRSRGDEELSESESSVHYSSSVDASSSGHEWYSNVYRLAVQQKLATQKALEQQKLRQAEREGRSGSIDVDEELNRMMLHEKAAEEKAEQEQVAAAAAAAAAAATAAAAAAAAVTTTTTAAAAPAGADAKEEEGGEEYGSAGTLPTKLAAQAGPARDSQLRDLLQQNLLSKHYADWTPESASPPGSSANMTPLGSSAASSKAGSGSSIDVTGMDLVTGLGSRSSLGSSTRSNSLDPGQEELEQEWLIDPSEVQFGPVVGSGTSGEVYKALWRGKEVAVKNMGQSGTDPEQLLASLRKEMHLMKAIRHPNIVAALGVIVTPPLMCILTEYMSNGALSRWVYDPVVPMSWLMRINMALDVARGMLCLHTQTPPVLHRDLKTPNLLVADNWSIKVSDFGFSRLRSNKQMSRVGTPAWVAPEVMLGHAYNEKVDVYSFAIVMWELVVRKVPYEEYLDVMDLMVQITQFHLRPALAPVPSFSQDARDLVRGRLQSLIRSCWEVDPSKRPTFSFIADELFDLKSVAAANQSTSNQPMLPQRELMPGMNWAGHPLPANTWASGGANQLSPAQQAAAAEAAAHAAATARFGPSSVAPYGGEGSMPLYPGGFSPSTGGFSSSTVAPLSVIVSDGEESKESSSVSTSARQVGHREGSSSGGTEQYVDAYMAISSAMTGPDNYDGLEQGSDMGVDLGPDLGPDLGSEEQRDASFVLPMGGTGFEEGKTDSQRSLDRMLQGLV